MPIHTFVKITYDCSGDKIEIFRVPEEEAQDPVWDIYRRQTIVNGITSFHYLGCPERYGRDTAILFFAQLQLYYKLR